MKGSASSSASEGHCGATCHSAGFSGCLFSSALQIKTALQSCFLGKKTTISQHQH